MNPDKNTTSVKGKSFVFLYLSPECEKAISVFFEKEIGILPEFIQKKMHLTVYLNKHPNCSFRNDKIKVDITANVDETRFMVFAPGGENPRPNIDPSNRSVGIRLTKRNDAIPEILEIRRGFYKLEPKFTTRSNTTDSRNAFGAKNYQPHIKFLNSGNNIGHDLSPIGQKFRDKFKVLKFTSLVSVLK